jgi:hypothetical protein
LLGPFPQDEDPWEEMREYMERHCEWMEMEDLLDSGIDDIPGDFDDTPYESDVPTDFSGNELFE